MLATSLKAQIFFEENVERRLTIFGTAVEFEIVRARWARFSACDSSESEFLDGMTRVFRESTKPCCFGLAITCFDPAVTEVATERGCWACLGSNFSADCASGSATFDCTVCLPPEASFFGLPPVRSPLGWAGESCLASVHCFSLDRKISSADCFATDIESVWDDWGGNTSAAGSAACFAGRRLSKFDGTCERRVISAESKTANMLISSRWLRWWWRRSSIHCLLCHKGFVKTRRMKYSKENRGNKFTIWFVGKEYEKCGEGNIHEKIERKYILVDRQLPSSDANSKWAANWWSDA